MTMKKEIKRIISSSRHPMGEHSMYQPIPNHEFESIDPFLLIHHHGPHTFKPHNQGLPFGPHPHRGFETLTFIYSGEIEHADSQGFRSVIQPGGVQWMTAGRGIVHSENIPESMREKGGEMEIIQLWMNLPKRLKMTEPTYQGLQKDQIPVVGSEDGLVNTQVISGTHKQVNGTAKSLTNLTMLNVFAEKNGKEVFEVPESTNVMFYVLNGEVLVNGKLAIDHQLVDFKTGGTVLEIEAQTDSRFIIGVGEPLNEPVVAQGPFVMNSTTEILQAMRDYQLGKMGVM
jgi:redox-sensitive bicupin YhaK (pirin superfamily)